MTKNIINNSILIFLLVILYLFNSNLAHAFHQVTINGQAEVINNDLNAAREFAIKQAILNAKITNGLEVSISDVQLKRLITHNYIQLTNMNFSIKIQSETQENNKLNLKLALTLTNKQVNQCIHPDIKASIFISQARIINNQDINHGNLIDLNKAISNDLLTTTNKNSRTLFSRFHLNDYLSKDENIAKHIQKITNRTISIIGQKTHAQYILVPVIHSAKIKNTNNFIYKLLPFIAKREFKLALQLYHGITGELLWQKDFYTEGHWYFSKNTSISPFSQEFSNSDYGNKIKILIQKAIQDLDIHLACKPVLGQIIVRNPKFIISNLGRRHGIKVGDKLNILIKKKYFDEHKFAHIKANKISETLEITQITEFTSLAHLSSNIATANIQLRDLVFKQEYQSENNIK